MKYIIVTGDRYARYDDWWRMIASTIARHHGNDAYTLVHGAAPGVDTIAASVARGSGYCSAVVPFRADWKKHGKAAGPIRNGQMIAYVKEQMRDGDTAEVIAFHNTIEQSKGTKNMVDQSRRAGLPVTIYGSDGRQK